MNDLSLSERVIDDVLGRLCDIKKANGYRTDAGLYVFDSQHTISADTTPAVQAFEGSENAADANGSSLSMAVSLQIVCVGHAKANTQQTGKALRALKADIKKAVLRDRGAVGKREDGKPIGALTYVGSETQPRQPGDETESVVVTFSITFKEGYGDPYAPK